MYVCVSVYMSLYVWMDECGTKTMSYICLYINLSVRLYVSINILKRQHVFVCKDGDYLYVCVTMAFVRSVEIVCIDKKKTLQIVISNKNPC